MPAVLTHKTIMLLARERLADIERVLRRKTQTGVKVTDLEHRMLYLAKQAREIMSENDSTAPDLALPGVSTYATPLGQGVSRFAVMGSMGPDITGFSALLAPDNSWVFDTIHKGNPDQNREPIVARTTDFTLEFWRQVLGFIDNRAGATEDDKEKARARMRGYVMGHLCHLAGDIISHPFINDIEWHLGIGSQKKFTHSGGEGSIDAKVARQLLLRKSTREGQQWAVWWPVAESVPPEFFRAYDEALERVYTAHDARPAGFGDFEKEFKDLNPPKLNVDFVRDGYSVYRNAILPMGYGWGYWSWFGFLTPAMLPLMAMFPLSLAMPKGREFMTHAPNHVDGDRPFSEVLTVPMAIGSIIPMFYGIWVASVTMRGVEGLSAGGITTAVLSAISAIVFFATLGVDNLPWWARWLIYFGIPAGTGLFFSIKWLANQGSGEGGRRALALIYAAPFLIGVVFAALYFIAAGLPPLIAQGDTPTATEVVFGIMTGLFIIGIGIAWFLLPKKLRDARIPETPDPFPAERPHFVRLFDDTSLYHDPALKKATLAQRFYPSARRALLKLWWEGDGDLYIRSRRFKLEFSFSGNGNPDQVTPAVVAPMKAVEFAHFLTATVKDSHGATGKLKGAVLYVTDLDYELPPGATFADEGDPDEENIPSDFSVGKHDELAAKYHKLGKTQDATDYILYHAPKAEQAIRFGRNGPAPFSSAEGTVAGAGTVASSGKTVTGTGTAFLSFFTPGDQILASGQMITITNVDTDTSLTVAQAFSPALAAGTSFSRVGSVREAGEGYTYVAFPASCGLFGGGTIMDYAANIAAMLCMGAVPHLIPAGQLAVPTLAGKTADGGGAVEPKLGKIYQVFRNWSLDRRRLNEWRMLVAGGALSEKGEAADTYDSTMTQPRDADWKLKVPLGEPTARQLGWSDLMSKWLQVAGDRQQNAGDGTAFGAGTGAPSNLALSQAIAFLFDMPSPQVLR